MEWRQEVNIANNRSDVRESSTIHAFFFVQNKPLESFLDNLVHGVRQQILWRIWKIDLKIAIYVLFSISHPTQYSYYEMEICMRNNQTHGQLLHSLLTNCIQGFIPGSFIVVPI